MSHAIKQTNLLRRSPGLQFATYGEGLGPRKSSLGGHNWHGSMITQNPNGCSLSSHAFCLYVWEMFYFNYEYYRRNGTSTLHSRFLCELSVGLVWILLQQKSIEGYSLLHNLFYTVKYFIAVLVSVLVWGLRPGFRTKWEGGFRYWTIYCW